MTKIRRATRPVLPTALAVGVTGALGLTAIASLPASAAPVAPAVGAAAGSAQAAAVAGKLLPVPAVKAGRQLVVTAVDVSPSGTVVGTSRVTTTAPDGTQTSVSNLQRWVKNPSGTWQRKRLPLPKGGTSGTAEGLTDSGEAGGTVTVDGNVRAVRWSADGRTPTLIGDSGSQVQAVGPDGPWAVATDASGFVANRAELVARDGTRTALTGGALEGGRLFDVTSISGPNTALIGVTSGQGQGATAVPVVWRNGATATLPVFSSFFFGAACPSRIGTDGSAVVYGPNYADSTLSQLMVRHSGGVPGTDTVLSKATASGQPTAGITCTPGQVSNTLAADGGIGGFLNDGSSTRAAYWDAANTMTVVPLAAGEVSATGVAVANGGRLVVQARNSAGDNALSLWHNGTRTPLTTPAGWTVTSVTELTEAGLLVATAHNAAGTVRPVVWNVAG